MKACITSIHPCDETSQVVTTEGGGSTYRRQPCQECPWRRDAPIGAFPAEAFRHSASTAYDMAVNKFGCHMSGRSNPATCAGFLLSGAEHNLAVRLALSKGQIDPGLIDGRETVYSSYREMAEANGVDRDDPCLKPCR